MLTHKTPAPASFVHFVLPVGHSLEHAPFAQTWPAAQTVSHLPQFSVSSWRLTQILPHCSSAAPHARRSFCFAQLAPTVATQKAPTTEIRRRQTRTIH